jgi:putative PIN family toxin of toxin-antitoxin system
VIYVFDTNVLISALRSRNGASNALLRETLAGNGSWLCSIPLFLEYEEVLMRAEFVLETGRSRDDYRQFLADVASIIEPVDLTFLWRPQLKDPKDEMVLETAVNGQADAIVTFNLRDFKPANSLFGIALISPMQALERTRS